ncbi:hypothetical protein [Tsukamurella ocularis]|uniref:hypothetical protein n=1 Tax=Tsukamurella ocularis TaxID=1970234 RepID=UPI002168B55B|nr:hypothetical protein [Tsukamurella ocularis]MCS3782399.1 hypothetical protein [Tsukamurella ocularis]MCS3789804.1 hypothetical protein [Tsukamurella ocularis]MCS3853189.1 hypothetical protein [Tsukamurella ocularis]
MHIDDVLEVLAQPNDSIFTTPPASPSIPPWWRDVLGRDGAAAIASAWDQLAPQPLFPRFKDFLRSQHALGAVIIAPNPRHDPTQRYELGVAFDRRPGDDDETEPCLIRLATPLGTDRTPPWWQYYPEALRAFFTHLHAEIADTLPDPSSYTKVSLASQEYWGDSDNAMFASQTCPDPTELLNIARRGDDALYLDIGQQTFQGWEIRGDREYSGGPHPVDLPNAIDAYLTRDDQFLDQYYTPTEPEDAPHPAAFRTRNPAIDWPADPFWDWRTHTTTYPMPLTTEAQNAQDYRHLHTNDDGRDRKPGSSDQDTTNPSS